MTLVPKPYNTLIPVLVSLGVDKDTGDGMKTGAGKDTEGGILWTRGVSHLRSAHLNEHRTIYSKLDLSKL